MSFSYDKTSVLEPAGERKFYHTFENQWLNESGGPLGSMIIAVTLKAILAVTKPLGKPHPVSLYSNFFASPSAGQRVEIEVTIQKDGRAFCFAEGKVYIPSKKNPGSLDLAFCAQGAFSNLAPDARLPIFSSRPMAIPYYKLSPYPTSTGKAPAECVSVYDLIKEDLFAPFYLNFQMLVDKDAVEDVLKQTKAKMAAGFVDDMMDASYGDIWIGDTDQRPIDYEALAIYTDVLPTFNARIQNEYAKNDMHVMSTVSEAIHFIAPIPDDNGPFVRARANVTIASRDLMEYEVTLWARNGQPIAVGRQIGLMRKLDGAPEGSVAAELGKKSKM